MGSVADLWDAEADRFDDQTDHGLTDPEVRDAWSGVLGEVIPESSAVLDVGCGTGSLSLLLAAHGHTVTGIDLSPRMLARARHKAEERGASVRFLLGDASAPAVDAPFDVVLARRVVWALPDPSAAVDRWLDLLRTGGSLVLIEGRWGLGAGLSAAELSAMVEPRVARLSVRHLADPRLWGRAVTDERYLLLAATS